MRVLPTRSAATDACRAGHVRVNEAPAKPATTVRCGDLVALRLRGAERLLEVVRVIDKRVGAPLAAECLVDRSAPRPSSSALPAPFLRDRGAARPTKRDRRRLDRLHQGRDKRGDEASKRLYDQG